MMNRLNDRHDARSRAPLPPMLAARRRRQLHPFFFHMGPVALTISSVLLIALMAVLYLSQLSQALNVNRQIQDYRAAQAALQRQNQDLLNTLAQEQSPAYIAAQAQAQGLVPADPAAVQVLEVPDLQPVPDNQHGAAP
jgi:cell division protein FtsL